MSGGPNEILTGPVSVFVATAGTANPEIGVADADLPAAWNLLGASLSDDGLVLTPSDALEPTRTLDSPRRKKLHRTEDDLEITCALVDLTVETFGRVLNNAAVTSQAASGGTAGYRQVTIGRGFDINYFAVLVRGTSPYNPAFYAQYHFACAHVQLTDGPTFVKSPAAMLGVTILPIDDTNINAYGTYRAQNAAQG